MILEQVGAANHTVSEPSRVIHWQNGRFTSRSCKVNCLSRGAVGVGWLARLNVCMCTTHSYLLPRVVQCGVLVDAVADEVAAHLLLLGSDNLKNSLLPSSPSRATSSFEQARRASEAEQTPEFGEDFMKILQDAMIEVRIFRPQPFCFDVRSSSGDT
jgi:hypothetical protein